MPSPAPLFPTNTFYARFEASNAIPMARLAEDQDDCTLCLCRADVRRAFKRVNPVKSPGPDGIPGHVLVYTNQLVEVFTSIFNLSLNQSAGPTCFTETTIVPIPKTSPITSSTWGSGVLGFHKLLVEAK